MSYFNVQDSIYITSSNKNVGIGITNPSNNLSVSGDIDATTDYNINGTQVLSATTLGSGVVNSSLTSLGTQAENLDMGDYLIEGAKKIFLDSDSVTNKVNLTRSDNSSSGFTITQATNQTVTLSQTENANMNFQTNNTTRLRLEADGDINAMSNNITGVADIAFTSATIKGHMIPDTDDAYDIGSAEFKIRDMYVSDNSLWVGDEHKISISGGKMKFRKRKTSSVPAAVLAAAQLADGSATESSVGIAAVSHANVLNLSSMKLKHWRAYMRTIAGQSGATIQDIFRDNTDDYSEESETNWLQSGTKTYNTTGNLGVGTSDPAALLHLHFDPEASQGLKELLRLSWNDANYDTLKGDGTKITFHLPDTNNFPGTEEAGYFGVMKANAVEADMESDISIANNDGTNMVERIRILSTGHVGIGNATPTHELDVAGDINFTGTLYQNGSAFTSGDPAVWSSNGTSRYYNGGYVGIGDSTPSYPLDIHRTEGKLLRLKRDNSSGGCLLIGNNTTGTGNLSGFHIGYSSSNSAYLWNMEDSDIMFYTNGASDPARMTIKNDGKIGIGLTNPGYNLEVSGSIYGDSINIGSSGNEITHSTGNMLFSTAGQSNALAIGHAAGVTVNSLLKVTNTTGIEMNVASNNGTIGGICMRNGYTISNAPFHCGMVTYDHSGSGSGFGDGLVLSGYDGIAFATSNTTATSLENVRMMISQTGNVGIGNSSPSYKLDVNGEGRFQDNVIFNSANANKWIIHTRKGNNGDRIQFSPDNTAGDNWDWSTSLVFTRTGRLGVMNQTPAYPLDVTGDINLTGDLRQNGSIVSLGGSSVWSESSNVASYGNGTAGTIKINSGDGVDKIQLTAVGTNGSKINHSGGWSIDYYGGPGTDANATGKHRFFTTDASSYQERMRISSNGNVGIGCAANKALEIEKTNPIIRLTDERSDYGSVSGVNLGSIEFYSRDGSMGGDYAGVAKIKVVSDNSTVAPDGAMVLCTGVNGVLYERIRISSAGKVGIGCTPSIDLAIGDSDTGFNWVSDGKLGFYTNNAERFRLDNSGNFVEVNGGYIQGRQHHAEIILSGATTANSTVYQNKDQAGNVWRKVYLKHTWSTGESIPKVGAYTTFNRAFSINNGFNDSNIDVLNSTNSPNEMYELKCSVKGVYQVNYNLKHYNSHSDCYGYARIRINGSGTAYGYTRMWCLQSKTYYLNGSDIVRMNAGDSIHVETYSNAGDNDHDYNGGRISVYMIGTW